MSCWARLVGVYHVLYVWKLVTHVHRVQQQGYTPGRDHAAPCKASRPCLTRQAYRSARLGDVDPERRLRSNRSGDLHLVSRHAIHVD